MHSGVEHGGYTLLGISPPGLLEVIACVDGTITAYFVYLYIGGKWLRQTFGSPRQCRSASAGGQRHDPRARVVRARLLEVETTPCRRNLMRPDKSPQVEVSGQSPTEEPFVVRTANCGGKDIS